MSNQPPNHSERRPVAYLNEKFLNSPDARGLRILSEFLEPLAHFRRERVRDTVVFFGSARLREEGVQVDADGDLDIEAYRWDGESLKPRKRSRPRSR